MSVQKRKGTTFESDVVRYLQENGFPHAERRACSGVNDRGDIAGVVGWVIECKATKRIDLGEFAAEAEREAQNAGCSDFALVVKRRMKSVRDAYAVLPLWLFVELLHDQQEGEMR